MIIRPKGQTIEALPVSRGLGRRAPVGNPAPRLAPEHPVLIGVTRGLASSSLTVRSLAIVLAVGCIVIIALQQRLLVLADHIKGLVGQLTIRGHLSCDRVWPQLFDRSSFGSLS